MTKRRPKQTGVSPAAVINNPSKQVWLAWAGIWVVYGAMRLNCLAIPLERDEGLFGYVAQVLHQGGVPYLHVIDHKPPMVYFFYALGLVFVPATAVGIHLFLHVFNALTLLVLYGAARRLSGSAAAGLCVAFCYAVVSSLPALQGFSASTEMLMLLPIGLCLYCAVPSGESLGWGRLLLCGVFAAMACWTKQTGFFVVAAILGYGLLRNLCRRQGWRTRLKSVARQLALWAAGGLLFSGALIGLFFAWGALDAFWYWTFEHNLLYGKVEGDGSKWGLILQKTLQVLMESGFVAVMGIAAAAVWIRRRNLVGWLLVFMLVGSFLAVVPGGTYNHYFAQMAPALALAGGLGWAAGMARFRNAGRRLGVVIGGALLIVAVPLILRPAYYVTGSPETLSREFFSLNPFPESTELADFLRRNTTPDETIFVFGSEAQVLFYSGRNSASPFALMYPLTRQVFPRHLEFQNQVWRDIVKASPRYVVWVNLPTSLMWDGKADLDLIRRLGALMKSRYRLEAVMTVEDPRGRLLMFHELKPDQRFPIAIYRRN